MSKTKKDPKKPVQKTAKKAVQKTAKKPVQKAAKKAAPPAAKKPAREDAAKLAPKPVQKPAGKEGRASARLAVLYRDEIRPALMKQFGYKNMLQTPRLEKIVLNMGVGEAVADRKKASAAQEGMAAIAGQMPVITRARKSEAGFKLREGMPVGVKVTLRRERMYEFVDRLVNIALPRLRDFRGLSVKSFDGHGNYALGIREHIVFPEIDYDKVEAIRGMDVVICTTAKQDEEAKALLAAFSFPFRN